MGSNCVQLQDIYQPCRCQQVSQLSWSSRVTRLTSVSAGVKRNLSTPEVQLVHHTAPSTRLSSRMTRTCTSSLLVTTVTFTARSCRLENLFEAVQVYKLKGQTKWLMIGEFHYLWRWHFPSYQKSLPASAICRDRWWMLACSTSHNSQEIC
jgi:hypothetical protein